MAQGTKAMLAPEASEAHSRVEVWAGSDAGSECDEASADQCLAPACTQEHCALYRCEDLTPGRVVRARGSLPARPSMIQRYNLWGLPITYWQYFELPPAPLQD